MEETVQEDLTCLIRAGGFQTGSPETIFSVCMGVFISF
jgi:hypothetical protein